MSENYKREKPTCTATAADRTIAMPKLPSLNDRNYETIERGIKWIQHFSIGNGGKEVGNNLVFSFDQEEYNCCVRVLEKYDWVVIKT